MVLSRQIEGLKRAKSPPIADRPIEIISYITERHKRRRRTYMRHYRICPHAQQSIQSTSPLRVTFQKVQQHLYLGKIGLNITWSCSLPSEAVTASEGPIPLAVESFSAKEGGSAHDVNKELNTSARRLLTVLKSSKRKPSSPGAVSTPRISPSSNSSAGAR